MQEVKVKAYGLVNFTKKQYLITQTIGFFVLLTLFLVAIKYDFASSDDIILKYATTGIIVIFVLEIFETAFMLMKFKKAEQSAGQISGDQ